MANSLIITIIIIVIVVFIVLNSFMLHDKDEIGKYKRRGKRLNYFKVEITTGSAGDDCRYINRVSKPAVTKLE